MKNVRTLDEIARDVLITDRDNIFRKGELLIEAKETHPGEFLAWLQSTFNISADTAERYMDVARLGQRFRKIAESNLAKTTFYYLANRVGWDKDQEAFAELIDILVEKSNGRFLRAAEAEDIIDHFYLSKEYGDYPVETLRAIESLSEDSWYPGRKGVAWVKSVIAALKKQKPTTGEAVDECVAANHVAHVAKLYAPHGKLPLIPLEKCGIYEEHSLNELEKVEPKRRRKVLAKLSEIAAERPLTHEDVKTVCGAVDQGDAKPERDDTDQDDDAEQETIEEAELDEYTEEEPKWDAFVDTWARTLETALTFFKGHAPPESFGDIMTTAQLRELRDYIDAYLETTDKRTTAQRAADRAEARSRTRH